jgi:hypothetical protein
MHPLKDCNSLAVFHWYPALRRISIFIRKLLPENNVANGRYRDNMLKGFHFQQIQKQFPIFSSCLLQFFDTVIALSQELLLIGENCVFLLILLQILGLLIA